MPGTTDPEERDAWFEEPRTWSQIKLRILGKYIDAYRHKRGGKEPKFFYVDGFAGPGLYKGKGQLAEEGSPVRLARLAQKIKDDNKSYRLICINTERTSGRCARLRDALEAFSPELVHVLCGEFDDHIEHIIKMMGNAPAVCFLDPFGVKGISPKELEPLLKRRDTEFLLNLNTRALHRLSGSATSDAREARGKVKRLNEILGEAPDNPDPEWLRRRNELDSRTWEEWAVRRYMEQLHAIGFGLRYSLAYPVREKHKGGVKYYLVFASRSKHAFPIMTDLICTEDDDLALKAELASRPPGQQWMFAPAHILERESRFRELKDEVHAYGLAHQGCTREQIIQHFSFLYLGEFMQKHYRHLIDELVKEGRAEFAPAKGETKEKRPIRFR